MKNRVIALGLLVLFITSPVVFAEEAKEVAVQETNIESSGAVAVINKQPEETGIIQKIKVRKCGLILVVNVNGKVRINPDPEK